MTDLAMMFQSSFFSLEIRISFNGLGKLRLNSGPDTGSGAKDTNSEEVVPRVPKKFAILSGDSDLVQEG
jgi:hypothetical protein